MLRRYFRWLGSVVGGFCAGFLAFAAVFGAIGLAVAGPFSPEKTCWPHHSVIYMFETYCANGAADWAWWGTVELARYAVAMPALALYLLQEALLAPVYFNSLIDNFIWALAAVVCLIVWAGFRHWHARSPASAWGLLATVVAQAALAAAPVDLSTPVAKACGTFAYFYFPAGSFRDFPSNPDTDGFSAYRYTKHLSAMQEPPLSCGASLDTETYRVLVLPTFRKPISVRVYRRGGEYRLEAVVLDGMGGYEPGKILKRVHKTLSPAQWQRVVRTLDDVRFWRRRTTAWDLIGIDGTDVVVEARVHGRYHVVARYAGWSLWPVGDLLLELAGLDDADAAR